MKELLTDWIVNLTLFSLLSTVITRMLPGKSYVPYIRIFCGIMMILTFLQPLFKFTGLENKIQVHFVEDLLLAEQYQMENELIRIEEEQKKEVEEQYRQYLENEEAGD